MTDAFSVLPAPPGYQLITISDDDGDPIIENRLSQLKVVLGFVVHRQGHYFSVLPVTAFEVHGDLPEYALIRPDGKVETLGIRGDGVFESIDDWKQFMRREAAATYREVADSMAKDGDKKVPLKCGSAPERIKNKLTKTMSDVQRFLTLAKADQEKRQRRYADSTAIALKIYAGVFVFLFLCVFGW